MTALAPLPPAPPAPVFATVPIYGREILAVRVDDGIRVPMRSFCGALGLPWAAQRQRLARDPLLREGVSMMLIPSAGGAQRQVTLPAELISGFLFGCEASRFAPELRERVELFRRECFHVLHAHFAGLAAAPAPALPRADPADLARASAAIVGALAAATAPAARRHLHAVLALNCAALGLDVPDLDAIGLEAASLGQCVADLVEAGRVLEARRRRWNHAAADAGGIVLAIDLAELAGLFIRADVDFDLAPLAAALARGSTARLRVTRRTVNSAITRKPVFAWLVEEWRS